MAKKISLNIWVEPATNAGGYSQMISNIEDFIDYLNKYGLVNIGEEDFDLEIVDTEADLED